MSAPVLGPSESRVEPPAAATAPSRRSASPLPEPAAPRSRQRHCRSRVREPGPGAQLGRRACVKQHATRNRTQHVEPMQSRQHPHCKRKAAHDVLPMTMPMLSILASGGVNPRLHAGRILQERFAPGSVAFDRWRRLTETVPVASAEIVNFEQDPVDSWRRPHAAPSSS